MLYKDKIDNRPCQSATVHVDQQNIMFKKQKASLTCTSQNAEPFHILICNGLVPQIIYPSLVLASFLA